MKLGKLTFLNFAASAIVALTAPGHAPAQSVDALLDKLVHKGILTVKEANELRESTQRANSFGSPANKGASIPSNSSGRVVLGNHAARHH